jgi:hypothetical protein
MINVTGKSAVVGIFALVMVFALIGGASLAQEAVVLNPETSEEPAAAILTVDDYGLPALYAEMYGNVSLRTETTATVALTVDDYGLPAFYAQQYGNVSPRTVDDYGLPALYAEMYGPAK